MIQGRFWALSAINRKVAGVQLKTASHSYVFGPFSSPQKSSIGEYASFQEEFDGLKAQRGDLSERLKTLSQVRGGLNHIRILHQVGTLLT